ncbi:MAG: hypothetical protein QM690_17655 [Sphingobium sp.]
MMAGNGPALRFWPRVMAAAGAAESERLDGDGEIVHRFCIGPSGGRHGA